MNEQLAEMLAPAKAAGACRTELEEVASCASVQEALKHTIRVGNDMVVVVDGRTLRKKAQGADWASSKVVGKAVRGWEIVEVFHSRGDNPVVTRRRYDRIEDAVASFDED